MRTISHRALAFCMLVALPALGCGRGQQADADQRPCFLWKITSDTNTVYLLGSLHVGKKEYYPLPRPIEEAFEQCKTLVVEVDPTRLDPVTAAKLINTEGVYPPGQSLSQSISKETLEKLKAYCAGKKVQAEAFESYRPWTLTLLFAVGELKAIGLDDQLGLDRHFVNKAKKLNKPVVELETAAEQIELFSRLSPELQEDLLDKSLADMGALKEVMEKTWDAWQAGDAPAMDQLLIAPYRETEYRDLIEKVYDDRNVKMAARIEAFLKERERYFVVVGAGHVVGEKGIVQLLEDKKYKIEQVQRSASAKKAA